MNNISLKWKIMNCTCRNNSATICQRKVNCDFLFSCSKNDNCSRFQNFNKSVVGHIINNPLPNLHSRGTSIQETLSSVLWLHPHWKQALLFGWAKWAAWQRASEYLQGKEGLQRSVINFSLYFAQMRGNTIAWKMTFWKSKLIDNRPSWPALNFRGKRRNTNFQDVLIAKTVVLALRVKVLDCK